MAQQVLMPKQGNSVETCIIIEWKKQEGDAVSIGDILCEAETDKATIEVESTAEGVLLKQLYKVDDEVPVQVPLVIIGEAGEDISALVSSTDSESSSSVEAPVADSAAPTAVKAPDSPETPEVPVVSAASGISPRAKKLAVNKGINYANIAGTGPKGRIIERDIEAAVSGSQTLTPAAQSALASGDYSVPATGSGIGGRVRTADLQTPVSVSAPEIVSGDFPGTDFPGKFTEKPVRSIRKITAKRMFESISTTCQLTLHATADAARLKEVRARFKATEPGMGLSGININDLILFAAAKTLVDFPFVNTHFLGDKIIEFNNVHLGTAVDTDRGLMVPVIKFADSLSIKELSVEAKRLAESSKTGKISPDELDGGTFTVTNLGAFGIDRFTPVLNIPQTAILGVGGIDLKPVETTEGVQFIPHISLSLTFDHQAIDGAPAARFLKALADNIRNIDLLMIQ